jgi:CubicO group peptidase (beta-lactamase class C family)
MDLLSLSTYLYRYIAWNAVGIDDYKQFPGQVIQKAGVPLHFAQSTDPFPIGRAKFNHKSRGTEEDLLPFLEKTGTTALIVIKDGKLLYEGYFNGYNRSSINTSFSVAKSITSLLIGIALEEQLIKSVNDSIRQFLPELPAHFKDITIHHLLNMCSGLSYREGVLPWRDDPLIYYGPDLRRLARQAQLVEKPGKFYHYNNYNLLLLGMLIEKVTGMSPAAYLQEKIWKHIGAEADASWSTDSLKSDFPKMESGLNATAMDFARLAWLLLKKGNINGKQILPAAWLETTFSPPKQSVDTGKYIDRKVPPLCQWAGSPHGFYHNLWWGYRINDQESDHFALGVMWQLLYLAPRKDTVIVRFGKKWGHVDWWPLVLKNIVDEL